MRASKVLGLALAVAVASLLATTPSMANCGTGGSIFQGFAGFGFAGCGDNAVAFIWSHQRAVQSVVTGATTNGTGGVDSGALSTVGDGVLTAGALPGSYTSNFDWGFSGPDGCTVLALESDLSTCDPSTGLATLPVNDFALAGKDPANPLHTLAALGSIDGNEVYQAWILDQAGALAANATDQTQCIGYANDFATDNINCGSIPTPAIAPGTTCDTTGCTLQVTIGPHTTPILTDCEIAMSRTIDCTGPAGDPRNLYVGRQLFVKRAPCTATAPGAVGAFDTRTFAMDPTNFPGVATPNFVPYSPQDLNLNGVVDAGETGPFTFVRVSGNASTTVPVHIPKIAGATDCVYLGVGLVYDSVPIAPGVNVFSPRVSVNGIPISADTGTPAADKVLNLTASKASGKANVAWDTSAELTTVGFNLIGTKKNGGSVQLNSSLIQAKQGTTGGSASYSIDLSSGDLKGSTAVYVELVKTNGAKERFGPASF